MNETDNSLIDQLKLEADRLRIMLEERDRAVSQQYDARMNLIRTNSDLVRTFDSFVKWIVDAGGLEPDDDGYEIIAELVNEQVLNDPFSVDVELDVEVHITGTSTITVRAPKDHDLWDIKRSLQHAIESSIESMGSFSDDTLTIDDIELPISIDSSIDIPNMSISISVETA